MPNETPDHVDHPHPWGRLERNRLRIWAAIGIVFPGLCVAALRLVFKSHGDVLSVKTELPVAAFMAFFVVLAAWIVSRMEKRPLDDYGVPPRQISGIRFWEGAAGASPCFP
jgi:hypothetical protein